MGGTYDPVTDKELAINEYKGFGSPQDPASSGHELTDAYTIDKLIAELDRGLRQLICCRTSRRAHGSISKRHQHTALGHPATVLMLCLAQEREVSLAFDAFLPNGAD
nr:hypothetical protein [Bosea sp. PAMC 26642]